MEELKKMLKEKFPNINFDEEKELITNGLIDSLDVVEIVSEIQDLFDVTITMEYLQTENFESIETMWNMIEELQ